ncbi:mucin-5AC-like [Amphibalanus amphitrite]|uniref:mucin-5AC-like n=1 Tax=Amphibalanus amphitrite TaxID=1232801 RepID=UPI001C91D27D|nr:mucin-5AC-like [Amphibalanus amphitrite]
MRRILLVVLCALAVAHGQNRGSRRFTPSPFLEGQDWGFVPSSRTTPQPWSGQPAAWPLSAGRRGTSRRRTTPQPRLGENDIDDGFGAVSAAKEEQAQTPKAPAAPRRQPQRTRTSVRRRRPTRVQAAEVTVPDVAKVPEVAEAGTSTTARPARRRTTSRATETTTLSLLRQQVEELKKQAQQPKRRFRGRRVKKIRRIIHPGEDEDKDEDEDEEDEAANELQKSETVTEKPSESTEASPEATSTTTLSPIILRRQKKIFRQGSPRRGSGSRRQFASRRRVVTPAAQPPTEATTPDPTTVPTVIIQTSSPFEPFPLDDNEVDDTKTADDKEVNSEASPGTAFTRITSTAGGKLSNTSSSSSSSASVSTSESETAVASSSQSSSGSSLNGDSSTNEVESSSTENEVRSEGAVVTKTVRRPISRGSVRASSAFTRTRGSQGVSRGSGRGRARGSGRQRVSSSSATSSSSSTSRRQFARRRRPSASAAANAITTSTAATTTTTTAATTITNNDATTTGIDSPTTQLTYGKDGLAFPNSLESSPPGPGQVAFNSGSVTGTPFPTVSPVTSFGRFQPVTSSSSFRFGSGEATRFGVTPRPVSSTTFAPAFGPTTPAVPAQFFDGSFGNRNFGQTTPVTTTVFGNTISENDFRPTPASEPVTFFSSANSQGAGSGRPGFGSFSFGANSVSSSSFGRTPSFNSVPVTARPTFRTTTAEPDTTTFGFSNEGRFGSQSSVTTGGFRPISFTTRHPAPAFNTDTNVRISSNGAFSFGTGVANPSVPGSDFSQRVTTPRPELPTGRPFTSSFGVTRPSSQARVPAVLTEAARFFGLQTGPTVQTNFGPASSSGGSVSTFSQTVDHPAPASSSGSFSFGRAVTGASTLVQSVATSPAPPATTTTSRPETLPPATEWPQSFPSVTEWPKSFASVTEWPQTSPAAEPPTSHTSLSGGQTFSHSQQQGPVGNSLQEKSRVPQKQPSSKKSSSSSTFSSSSSQNSLDSGRSAGSGRSFGSSSGTNTFFRTGGVRGFEFQQEGGVITRSSHLRGFDTRLPAFHENVVISDPVFSSKDIKPGFTCEGRPYGYYADEANDCSIFHICQPVDVSSVSKFYTRYSFFCGAETRFDQSKLSCLHKDDAMPCSESASWLFRNDEFGIQEKRSNEQRFKDEVQGTPAVV